jgi:glycosyltransferase involved in cell wall biosynthesis
MPSTTVVIPTYNRAAFLPATLRSVFAQTVPPDEVILADDGSTDDTRRVVDALLVENPAWVGRLRYIWQENQGKCVVLNNVLPLARGDWIAFNDSDDRWQPEKLEWQFRALARYPECQACFTESNRLEFLERHPEFNSSKDGHLGKVPEPSWLYARDWPGAYIISFLVRADAVRRCGEFDIRFRVAEDTDFLFRLGLQTPFCYVDLPLVEIDQSPTRNIGLTSEHPARSWSAMRIAELRLQKWVSMLDDSRGELRRVIRHELASSRSALANRYLLAGDIEAAVAELDKCTADCPELRLSAKRLLIKTAPSWFRHIVARRAPSEFLTDVRTDVTVTPSGRVEQ